MAAVVLDLAVSRAATLGPGRLICIDGPAGSGKTTLAARLAAAAPRDLRPVRVVHMDDLFAGWSGLDAAAEQLTTLLHPLATGEPGSYRRYDWHAGAWAETVRVEPAPLLVVEGVGSARRRHADLCTVLVHIDAPAGLRLERGLARDGESAREHWLRWMTDEQVVLERERTEERADVLVDGTGVRPPVVRA